MEVGLGRGDFVLDGDPAPPTERHSSPTNFEIYRHRLWLRLYNVRSMSVVAKRLDG